MKKIAALLAILATAGCTGGPGHPEGTMRTAIKADRAPKPSAPYSQGILSGDFILVSGQGGVNPATGKLEPGGVKPETKQTFENIKAILEAAGSSMDKVVK